MLASIAALHLLLAALPVAASRPLEGAVAQADAPPPASNPPLPSRPGGRAPDAEVPSDTAPPPAASEAAPAAPAPASPPAAATPSTATPSTAAPAAASPTRSTASRQRFVSLHGAETLGGAQALTAWAGWSSLGAAWAMGVTSGDDAGAFTDYDWAKSEFRLGGLYRRALTTAAVDGYDVAFRLAVAYYANLGSTYVYSDNHSEHGVDLSPGVVWSERAGGGLLAASADAPLTITTKYRTGLLFSPRVGVSYEMPLYAGLNVGARIGAGYRAGSGDAPLRTARGEFQFLVLATWQLL